MASLADVSRRRRLPRQLWIGIALLAAGAAVAVVGWAAVALALPTGSGGGLVVLWGGTAVAGLLVPAALLVAAYRTSPPRKLKTASVVAAGAALVGVVAFVVGGVTPITEYVLPTGLGLYVVGTFALLGTTLYAVVQEARARRRHLTSSSPSLGRIDSPSRPGRSNRGLPTDGGENEETLRFPTDESDTDGREK